MRFYTVKMRLYSFLNVRLDSILVKFKTMKKTIERVTKMETILDDLTLIVEKSDNALTELSDSLEDLNTLKKYYGNPIYERRDGRQTPGNSTRYEARCFERRCDSYAFD